MTGSEAGPQPVTPGTVPTGEYTTLATTEPEFLQNSEQTLMAEWDQTRGQAAYATVANGGFWSSGMG